MQNLLEKLIRAGEGESLDFKQTISSLPKIAKTISSFANSKGGNILVGVKDNGSIGQIDPEEEKYMLNKAAGFYCKPPVTLHFKELEDEESGNTILWVIIKESSKKPHYALSQKNCWQVNIRHEDRSLAAGKLAVSLMKKGTEATISYAGLDNLERNLIELLRIKKKLTITTLLS